MINFNLWGKDDTEKPLDFPSIKAICGANIEAILQRWLPGGKIVRGEYLCGSLQGGSGQSCSTNLSSGVGSDFSTGETWGDVIDLVAQVEQVSMSEAARLLSDFLHIDHTTPIPAVVPTVSPELKYEAGKREAMNLWLQGESCPHTHPYLVKKGVNADGLIRIHPATGNILIPLRDEHNELWALQRISPDGAEKRVTFNGKLSGNFHVIGGDQDTVYVCEGYATAMTVAMATGKTSVMAVSAGNLTAVGEKIARMYPLARLVFAADNDQDKDPNPGVKAALSAAAAIGRGSVIFPPFPEGQKGDWNDYALIHGASAVRSQLVKDVKQLFVDVNDLSSHESEFLIDGVMETPCTGMVFGASGSGKSFFILDIGLHIAAGRKWLNKETKAGPVFYICGEGRHGIPRRVAAWEKHHNCKLPKGRFLVSNLRLSFEPESVIEMKQCIDHLAESIGTPALIIIDTMARALPGNADENSAKDTNLFFNECDRLQSAYSCAVVVVHHSGHSDGKRARGSSAIKGALDVEIMLSNGLVEWTKTKDMEPHQPIRYELEKVVFGEGKRDQSCVITYDTNVKVEKKESAHRAAAKTSLIEAIKAEDLGSDRCTVSEWRNRFKTRFEGLSDRAQQKYFKAQLKMMTEEGLIAVDGVFAVVINYGLKESIHNQLIFNNKSGSVQNEQNEKHGNNSFSSHGEQNERTAI